LTALSILLIGFLLGMKHATEADHLAVVATLATRQTNCRRPTARDSPHVAFALVLALLFLECTRVAHHSPAQ